MVKRRANSEEREVAAKLKGLHPDLHERFIGGFKRLQDVPDGAGACVADTLVPSAGQPVIWLVRLRGPKGPVRPFARVAEAAGAVTKFLRLPAAEDGGSNSSSSGVRSTSSSPAHKAPKLPRLVDSGSNTPASLPLAAAAAAAGGASPEATVSADLRPDSASLKPSFAAAGFSAGSDGAGSQEPNITSGGAFPISSEQELGDLISDVLMSSDLELLLEFSLAAAGPLDELPQWTESSEEEEEDDEEQQQQRQQQQQQQPVFRFLEPHEWVRVTPEGQGTSQEHKRRLKTPDSLAWLAAEVADGLAAQARPGMAAATATAAGWDLQGREAVLLAQAGDTLRCDEPEVFALGVHLFGRVGDQLDDLLLVSLDVEAPTDEVGMLMCVWVASKFVGDQATVVAGSKVQVALQLQRGVVPALERHVLDLLHWRPFEGWHTCTVPQPAQ